MCKVVNGAQFCMICINFLIVIGIYFVCYMGQKLGSVLGLKAVTAKIVLDLLRQTTNILAFFSLRVLNLLRVGYFIKNSQQTLLHVFRFCSEAIWFMIYLIQ